MKSRYILSLSLLTTLFLGASCVQTQTNSNTNTPADTSAVVNSNETTNSNNDNLNIVVVNDNENTNSTESDIDTSNWLTYTNEEYGFSLNYPKTWNYETKQLHFPEEGILSILFLSPQDQIIRDSIDYTDQPVGFEVRVIENQLSPMEYFQEQVGDLDISYSEVILNNGLIGIAYNDPGLSEGIYRNIFSDGEDTLIDIRVFSEENRNDTTFIEFINSFAFRS